MVHSSINISAHSHLYYYNIKKLFQAIRKLDFLIRLSLVRRSFFLIRDHLREYLYIYKDIILMISVGLSNIGLEFCQELIGVTGQALPTSKLTTDFAGRQTLFSYRADADSISVRQELVVPMAQGEAVIENAAIKCIRDLYFVQLKLDVAAFRLPPGLKEFFAEELLHDDFQHLVKFLGFEVVADTFGHVGPIIFFGLSFIELDVAKVLDNEQDQIFQFRQALVALLAAKDYQRLADELCFFSFVLSHLLFLHFQVLDVKEGALLFKFIDDVFIDQFFGREFLCIIELPSQGDVVDGNGLNLAEAF